MKTLALHSANPLLGERLLQRLAALGAGAVLVQPDGVVELTSAPRWIEAVLLRLPALHAAVKANWEELSAVNATAVEVVPGIWLAPLPSQRRRRVAELHRQSLPAALLFTRAFLTSETFQLACSNGQLDAAATASQGQANLLADADEVRRVANLLGWLQQDTLESDRRVGEVHTLSQQLSESYEELSLLYKLSTSMTLDRPPAQFLTEACMELQQVLGLQWMALQLVEDEPSLNELAGQVFMAGKVNCDAPLLKRLGSLLMQRLKPGQPPLVVDDTQTLQIPYLGRIAKQLLVVSLAREDKALGILIGGDKVDESHISSIDSKLCNSLAASLTIFLENIMLFEDMSAMFMGTLHALTASIDAKDRYTHGHSERVAMLAKQLAMAAGIANQSIERVYISGLVHDIGKIGVPETVLCKPGKLTLEEFNIIKKHPEIGARILQNIRPMQDLITGVLYHHERWDGRGYPQGLAGSDIPLYGRIICIADSFDAMSSTRTYRRALSLDNVLGEIRRCAGTQFDPNLAQMFLTLDFQPFVQMLQQCQAASENAPEVGPNSLDAKP